MDVTVSDCKQMENVMKALRKGTFTIDGEEVIVLAQAFEWCGSMYKRMVETVASNEKQNQDNSPPSDVESKQTPTKKQRGRPKNGSRTKPGSG